MMWTFLTFLLGVLTGVALVCGGVWYILSFFFIDPDAPDGKNIKDAKLGLPKPAEPTSVTFQLPPVTLVIMHMTMNPMKVAVVNLNDDCIYIVFCWCRH